MSVPHQQRNKLRSEQSSIMSEKDLDTLYDQAVEAAMEGDRDAPAVCTLIYPRLTPRFRTKP